jgi:FOG: WD40 repeat
MQSTLIIVFTGEDKRIRIWDLAAGNMLMELKGHSQTVVGLSWSPNGETLASCGLDNTVKVWNVKSLPSNVSR